MCIYNRKCCPLIKTRVCVQTKLTFIKTCYDKKANCCQNIFVLYLKYNTHVSRS